jgi:hypothetical protein
MPEYAVLVGQAQVRLDETLVESSFLEQLARRGRGLHGLKITPRVRDLGGHSFAYG